MSSRTRILFWMVASLVLLITLTLGGYAIYRLSWSQGYQFALQSGDAAITPALPFGQAPFSPLLIIAIILVLLVILGKFLGGLFWLSVGPGTMTDWKRDPRFFHPMHHFHSRMNRCAYWNEYTAGKPDANEAPDEPAQA
jgi:hypothetical protein